ncbi:hypothetical protein G9A89_019235 [Geosiphon pyriformis]|nr:hypothetical protein G9A89_019235 [Geosiphon pyriformis]
MNKDQAITNLSTTNLSANNTHHLSATNPKTKTDTIKLEIVDDHLSTNSQFLEPAIKISTIESRHWELSKPKFPTLFKSSATITKNKLLNAIFPFELKKLSIIPLFSGATLEEKLIITMYTDAKVNGHFIKQILDSGSAGNIITKQLMNQLGYQVDHTASARIITTNQHQQPHPKVAKSENIGANYLGFTKFLFQHYCQHLGLIHNYILAESAFNFYVNERIAYLLRTFVNIESVRETFYNELIQNTSLSTNHNFTSIITEINKEIEHHIQQRYPITYTSKSKEKLQTPAVTSQRIQPSTWKKTRVESSNNPSYHYTPGSAINISSTDASTSNTTLAFERFQSLSSQPNFVIASPWEITELEGEQEPNLDNSENNTLNIQTPPNQNNPNPKQQQIAYAPIAKLNKFNSKEDDVQVWLNDMAKAITANNWDDARAMQAISYFLQNTTNAWYQSLAIKPQNFNGFKTEFLQYFSNNNSINKLANTFTTIRQGDTEAVTTYLGCFHRNLCQIQAIQADYFTVPQILNQFIRGLRSSILQRVRLMHPVDLPITVTYIRDFEAAELEANHAQAVNLAMNGSSELDSKLK